MGLENLKDTIDNAMEAEMKEYGDQAVDEFTHRIAMIKLSQSIRRASSEGDMELLNRLIKAKQDLDLQSRKN